MYLKTTLAIALSGLLAVNSSYAELVTGDFHRNFHGNTFIGGNLVGSFDYEFHYNLAPSHIQASSGGDAYVQSYTPFSGFQNQYYSNLTLFNGDGSLLAYALKMPVYEFTVVNDFPPSGGQPHDRFRISTRGASLDPLQPNIFGDLGLLFESTDTNVLSSISLFPILQGDADGIFRPGDGLTNLQISGAGSTYMLQVQTTGPLIADIPLPGTLPLAGTGLLGIAIAASRKRLA